MKIVKRVLLKAKETQGDPYKALMCLRATPVDNKLPSPAEMFLLRQIQDNLPRKFPRDPHSDHISERLHDKQGSDRFYHDGQTRPLPVLSPGQSVTVQNPASGKWGPSTVVEKAPEPRSYIITSPAGNELRRNRNQIREVPQSPQMTVTPNVASPVKSPVGITMSDSEIVKTRSGRAVNKPEKLDL